MLLKFCVVTKHSEKRSPFPYHSATHSGRLHTQRDDSVEVYGSECQHGAQRFPHLPEFAFLNSPLPYLIRVGLCDQQNVAEVTACHCQG